MLAIESLCVSIGGSRIIRDVTLELPDNKVFCLMGRNGVGKTTTLKTVIGLHKATSGSIRFDGKDISRMPAEARASAGIGYVPQGRGIFRTLPSRRICSLAPLPRGRSRSVRWSAFSRFSQSSRNFCCAREASLRRPAAAIGDWPRASHRTKSLDFGRADGGHPTQYHRPDRRGH